MRSAAGTPSDAVQPQVPVPQAFRPRTRYHQASPSTGIAASDADGVLDERAKIFAVASIAVALYPNLLPATPDPRYSLTIHNASASPYGLTVALVWFVVGLALIGVYTLVTHRPFIGRVRPGSEEY